MDSGALDVFHDARDKNCLAIANGVYLNFPGQGEEGETLLRASYGDATFERLVAVKTKYDPENFFRLNQNIQPMPRTG